MGTAEREVSLKPTVVRGAASSGRASVASSGRADEPAVAGPQPAGGSPQPSADPRQGMSPPALKILAAAQSVLVEKGFSGLTLRNIARESGENSAMVQYYFGNKEGLVKAMIDSVFRDDQQDAAAAMSTVSSDERLPRFVGRPADDQPVAFVPRLLRHPALRAAQRGASDPHGTRVRLLPADQVRLAAGQGRADSGGSRRRCWASPSS